MDLNCVYRKDEDGGVVVFYATEQAIVRTDVATLMVERNRNILEVLEEAL